MLCCVPKSLADGDPFHDQAPSYDEAPFHDEALFHDETPNKTPISICKTWVELYSEEDALPPILLPCAICARTFTPQSLEKHTRICERSATKKRKPFDSAKQRIQGTELAEFLPRQEPRRHYQDEKTTKSSWKKTHDDFLRTIREARGEVMDSSNKQCNSLISPGAPTRANEKGTCPTCNRQFGIKAYDRHVAWCKDRITQMQMSPATNLAKERLEARMRYKAPVIKNRRAINREKYSPGSSVNQGAKTSVSSPALVKPKESVSVTNGNRQSPMKQKPAVVKRPGQLKESPISSGPMKSRLIDRTNNGTSKDYDPFLLAEQQMKDLLSDMSDQSMTGSPKLQQTHDNLYPLSHSSAFVKYPISQKRSSLIEPPIEFDDVASDFSSDSTETNSISREIFLSKPVLRSKDITDVASLKPVKELGRRVIIDKSKALGVDERRGVVGSADRPRKIFDKVTPMVTKSLIDRSNSIRVSSAPRTNSGFVRKISNDIRKVQDSTITEDQSLSRSSDQSLNQSNNNYSSLSGSNLSLNSIISSSELDVKRSNSMFDELMTCFKEDEFNLRSFLNNDSFDLSSSGGDRQRNGSLISDGELSSPDSYKPRDHSKLSNDSAYSSLNRKYSHHGRSTNDVIGRLDEDVPRNETSPTQTTIKCKLSKFCHECGQRFPETAKFCCECGVRRLAL
ncbi:Zinc finger C2HC domain-containing protein 1A [Formica fusca]